jgi:hypothetical protein
LIPPAKSILKRKTTHGLSSLPSQKVQDTRRKKSLLEKEKEVNTESSPRFGAAQHLLRTLFSMARTNWYGVSHGDLRNIREKMSTGQIHRLRHPAENQVPKGRENVSFLHPHVFHQKWRTIFILSVAGIPENVVADPRYI